MHDAWLEWFVPKQTGLESTFVSSVLHMRETPCYGLGTSGWAWKWTVCSLQSVFSFLIIALWTLGLPARYSGGCETKMPLVMG